MRVALLIGLYLAIALVSCVQSAENGICPDQSQCPSDNTCCLMKDGSYGCCPLPEAVCCSDGQHCCPSGYTCDVSSGTCEQGEVVIPFFQKLAATPAKVNVGGMVCPNSTAVCPNDNTCCMMKSKNWGCCPEPEAVCCEDMIHCCAKGQKCDKAKHTCVTGDKATPWLKKSEAKQLGSKKVETIPWFTKTPALPNNVYIRCGSSSSQCPTGNTCCQLASGAWGCCPYPNAVCCSDGIHCCENGYVCDVAEGKCKKQTTEGSVPWMTKTLALPTDLGDVQCDASSACPDGDTCCKLASGDWGCCPLPKAVCCSDMEHCCPQGTTCDVTGAKCNKQAEYAVWATKTLAQNVGAKNVPCDESSACPDGSTCCLLASGQYGCCPLPKAVCCSDKQHCCPKGYTCNVSTGACRK